MVFAHLFVVAVSHTILSHALTAGEQVLDVLVQLTPVSLHGQQIVGALLLHVAPGQRRPSERRSPASESTATRATSNFPHSSACAAVSKPRPRLRGWTAVRAPAWRWGFESRSSPSF